MDLQSTWNKLDADTLSAPASNLLPPFKKTSRHPVQKLISALQRTLLFTVVFGLFFVVLLFAFEPWLIRALLVFMVASYALAYRYNLQVYKRVKGVWDKPFDGPLKETLQRIHQLVHSAIRFQERAALFVYPMAVATGYFMGLFVGNENKFDQHLSETFVLATLVIATLILTPLSYYLAKWMYKVSYDRYLHELAYLIHELNKEEK